MIEYFEKTLEIIKNSLNTIEDTVFNHLLAECKATLLNGGKIIVSGLGKNVPICEKFVGTMNSFGLSASFLHSNTAVHGDLGLVKAQDLVIVLSKSGNTRESIELIEYMKWKDPILWIMTFNPNGKMCKYTDRQFIMGLSEEGDLWNIAPNNSTTVFLIVLQALAISLSKELGITIDEFKENHPGGGIGEKLKGVHDD